MLNLFKIKGQKKEEAANTNGRPPAKKQSPGELRLHKGLFLQKFFFIVLLVLFGF
jgi:ubiquitin-conjugating enzyme E2 M